MIVHVICYTCTSQCITIHLNSMHYLNKQSKKLTILVYYMFFLCLIAKYIKVLISLNI